MDDSLGYDRLSDALARLGFSQNAAEYHGALCGALCVKPPEEIDPLRVLDGEGPAAEGGDPEQLLRRFSGQSLEAFDSPELVFIPLLPDDEEDLTDRVQALSSWCEGFLYGISTGRPLNLKHCSPEMKEIIKDFTEFTHAGLDEDPENELEETAYAELVEYIRVGAQLVYLELRRADVPVTSSSLVRDLVIEKDLLSSALAPGAAPAGTPAVTQKLH